MSEQTNIQALRDENKKLRQALKLLQLHAEAPITSANNPGGQNVGVPVMNLAGARWLQREIKLLLLWCDDPAEKPADDAALLPYPTFRILSLKDLARDNFLWWRPRNSGYTNCLEAAGHYDTEAIKNNMGYYNDGVHTIAVPSDLVASHAVSVVPFENKVLKDFITAGQPQKTPDVTRCFH